MLHKPIILASIAAYSLLGIYVSRALPLQHTSLRRKTASSISPSCSIQKQSWSTNRTNYLRTQNPDHHNISCPQHLTQSTLQTESVHCSSRSGCRASQGSKRERNNVWEGFAIEFRPSGGDHLGCATSPLIRYLFRPPMTSCTTMS